MNPTRVIAAYALALFFLLPASGHASETSPDIAMVIASGSAVIVSNDVDGSKRAAISDAKRNAVEQIGLEVISHTVVENFALVKDQIITRIDGYVHRFTVLEERRTENGYTVRIEAAVSKKAIIDDAALLYHDMNKPRLMVILPEVRGNEFLPVSHAEDLVSQFFTDKGFTLVDKAAAKANIKRDELRKIAEGDDQAAARLAAGLGAEVVVVGTASMGQAESFRGILYASKATVSLRALRSDNAMLYAVTTKNGSAADGIADAAQRKSVDQTGKEAAKDLFWRIVQKWNDERNMGADIELIVTGVNFSKLRKITQALRSLQGVADVVQRSFDDPTAVLTVTYKGDANRLADMVSEIRLDGATIDIQSVSSGKISLKVRVRGKAS